MEIKEELENILQTLIDKKGVLASSLIRKDGLFLVFLSNEETINKEISIPLASVFNIFEQTAEEIETGSLNYLLIKSQNKNIYFVEISKDIILVLFLDLTIEINEIYKDTVKITPKLMNILGI